MAKHRSFKIDKFLRAVDPELLKKYFSEKELKLPANTNFRDDSFEKVWDGIDEKKKSEVDDELQYINDTADEVRDCLEQSVKTFKIETSDDETSETTAMRVFLHSDEAFSLAFDLYLYHSAESKKLSHHKFEKGKADFSQSNFKRFRSEVEKHFKECGKSDNCDIRERMDGDKHICLIARGDFMKTQLIFESGKVETRTFRPAKEDVLVYDIKASILSVHINSRNNQDKEKYIEIFGRSILGLSEIDEKTLNNTLVFLDPIKDESFDYNGNKDIESIRLTEVRARLPRERDLFVTLKSRDIAEFLSKYGLSQDGAEFISAKLKFFIRREGKKSRPVSIEIKPPANSRVPKKKEKKIIEDYLREQGVLLA